jgi:hypothetical protein
MGREHPGERPLGDEELDATPGDAGIVGVLDRPARRASLGDRGADRAGDPRPQTVGADDPAGAELDRSAGAVMPGHPHHPAAPVAPHPGHRDPRAHLGTGPLGSGHQERVQHIPPRRHETVDPGLVLDRPADRLATGIERDLPDGRSTTVQDRIEQPPAAQLHHTAARDRMRRHGVAREGRLVHDHHVMPQPSQQHGGGRSGDASAHHNHVITAAVRGLHGHLPPVRKNAGTRLG